jgi:phage antirepressor YoqD-like protein
MYEKRDGLQLVGIRKASKILDISENTLRQWLCYRRFPYVKVGRRTMVAVEDLRRFVARNRVEATPRETAS